MVGIITSGVFWIPLLFPRLDLALISEVLHYLKIVGLYAFYFAYIYIYIYTHTHIYILHFNKINNNVVEFSNPTKMILNVIL